MLDEAKKTLHAVGKKLDALNEHALATRCYLARSPDTIRLVAEQIVTAVDFAHRAAYARGYVALALEIASIRALCEAAVDELSTPAAVPAALDCDL